MPNRKKLRWVSGEKTPAKTYITRVFNYGTFREWKAMKRRFSPRQIREAVHHPLRGQWNRHAKALAEVLFNLRMPSESLISYDL